MNSKKVTPEKKKERFQHNIADDKMNKILRAMNLPSKNDKGGCCGGKKVFKEIKLTCCEKDIRLLI